MRPGQKEYLVWQEGDDREDATVIETFNHLFAAEEWADDYDAYDDDCTIAQGEQKRVYVALNEPNSVAELYEVSGEFVRQYNAYLIEEEK